MPRIGSDDLPHLGPVQKRDLHRRGSVLRGGLQRPRTIRPGDIWPRGHNLPLTISDGCPDNPERGPAPDNQPGRGRLPAYRGPGEPGSGCRQHRSGVWRAVPLTRADDLAYITALRKSASQLRATTWPAQVQGYVAAMLLTYPASIACAQAVASAGSNSAATGVLSTNHACAQSQNVSDPHQVRMLLHLPSTAGHLPAI